MSKDLEFEQLGFPTKGMYEFPNIINVEVYAGDCPCSCVHCPVGTTEPRKRKEVFGNKGIDLELYKKIISEITEHSHSTLRVHSAGEPLIWENLVEALEFSRNSNVSSWIFTSAVTGNMSLLEAVCENADIVEVSVNSITSKDYKATKGIDAFAKVAENIEYMHNFIGKNKIPSRLIVSRVQSLDKTADEEFVKYWKSTGLVDDAFVRTYHTYNDIIAELDTGQKQSKHEACLVHWARFSISVDGYAVVCFNELFKPELNPGLILGDINKQTIAEIWHGPKLSSIREAELSGNYSKVFDGIPCKNCYSCQPLNGTGKTSENQIRQLRPNNE